MLDSYYLLNFKNLSYFRDFIRKLFEAKEFELNYEDGFELEFYYVGNGINYPDPDEYDDFDDFYYDATEVVSELENITKDLINDIEKIYGLSLRYDMLGDSDIDYYDRVSLYLDESQR